MDGGHRGVIFDQFRGVLPDVRSEGTHFIVPFVQRPYIIDVRTRPRVIKSITGTKDQQMVNIALRVLSHPQEDKLSKIFQEVCF